MEYVADVPVPRNAHAAMTSSFAWASVPDVPDVSDPTNVVAESPWIAETSSGDVPTSPPYSFTTIA